MLFLLNIQISSFFIYLDNNDVNNIDILVIIIRYTKFIPLCDFVLGHVLIYIKTE